MAKTTKSKPESKNKKSTSNASKNKASSATRQRKRNNEGRFRLLVRYAPAFIGLALIVVLFIYNAIGDVLPFGDEVRTDLLGQDQASGGTVSDNPADYEGLYNEEAVLSRFFPESVMYWEPKIYEWSQENGLNPNLVATIIQIESCGHPYVSSPAAAQGLFQVIPSNFQPGENQLDPEQNAATGLQIMRDCLRWTTDLNLDQVPESDPDVGLALVCYNGGPRLIYNRDLWVQESHNYYLWGTGIWGDASTGERSSPTLDTWLSSGGQQLCDSAMRAIEQLDPLHILN